MSKLIAAAVLVMLWTAGVIAGDAPPTHTVNLNKPGALEALQQSNPIHYDKVRKILDGILQQPDATVPRWLQANFDARNISYAPIVMTSDPPKKRLAFALDETHYEAVVTLANVHAEMVPLK